MQDRFKYRVWDKENECWLEDERVSINIDGTLTVLGTDQYGEDCFLNGEDFIVEQCTGLKDKNGRLIYEGDIIRQISKREPEYEEYITEVKWCVFGYPLYDEESFDFEVIGNIHENPKLMEE